MEMEHTSATGLLNRLLAAPGDSLLSGCCSFMRSLDWLMRKLLA
jgi:hypothetical protein